MPGLVVPGLVIWVAGVAALLALKGGQSVKKEGLPKLLSRLPFTYQTSMEYQRVDVDGHLLVRNRIVSRPQDGTDLDFGETRSSPP